MNSISRGYLYGAVIRLQCSCSSVARRATALRTLSQLHEGFHDRTAIGGRELATTADSQHRGMLEQGALHFERADSIATRK